MLARAKHLSTEFAREIAIFCDNNPCEKVIETNLNTGEDIHKIKFTKPIPVMLNGIASDAIGNLRSALDQAGYITTIAANPMAKGKNTHFPFGKNSNEVRGCRRGLAKEIPPEIFDCMASFNPYLGGDNLLWSLNKLCNSNKHRIIYPAAMIMQNMSVKMIDLPADKVWRFGNGNTWDWEQNEMVIATVNRGQIFNYEVALTSFVSFKDIDVIRNQKASAVLDALCSKVDSILMAIEAEARRIGLFK